MATNKVYLNGVFAEKKQGQFGEFWSLWIPNKDEFIQNLHQLPTDARGGFNFTLSEQKNDPKKGSISLYQPEPKTGGATQGGNSQYKPKYEKQPVDDSQDLPF